MQLITLEFMLIEVWYLRRILSWKTDKIKESDYTKHL